MAFNDRLFVIDLDRTLLDLDKVMALVKTVCKNIGIDSTSLTESYVKSSAGFWSYSPLKAIEDIGSKEKLSEFKREFVELAQPQTLLYEDAQKFLAKLDELKQPYMLLTHAVDEQWQQLKIEAVRLSRVPCIITFEKVKSRVIADWLDDSGKFKAPLDGLAPVDQIILIDDRERVFQGLPANSTGYWLNRNKMKAELPTNVNEISSFDQILDRL